jgi:flagellar biosynthetic protein FlhB
MGDEDKNFEASQQKLKRAREQGQVIKSQDMSTALFIVVMFSMLLAMSPAIWQVISETFIIFFEQIPHKHLEDIDWRLIAVLSIRAMALLALPFLFAAAAIAIIGQVAQVGLMITTKTLEPKFDKLNPVNGFKNIFSKRSLIELIKNIIKIGLLGYLAYMVFMDHIGKLIAVASADNVFAVLYVVGEILTQFIIVASIAFFVIGGFDYLYQRNKFLGDQKMSMKEMKDEYKQSEGDPMVKHMMRQRRMQMMQRRMLEAVPTADVVVTNPMHVAVALQYDTEVMEAPTLVAKGVELFAEEIKKLANQHNIPIVENPLVARTLYKTLDVNQPIAPDMYQAVAEILLFAWKLQGKTPPPMPEPSSPSPATPPPQTDDFTPPLP